MVKSSRFFTFFSQDRVGTVRKIADFLGKVLTDEQVNKIVEHTSLESMKYNPAVNFAYFEQEFDTDKTDGEFINSGKRIELGTFGLTLYQMIALIRSTKKTIFVVFVEDIATMSLILYFENRVSHFVRNRRK